MNKSLISIIIPNYNRADLINETLLSITKQTCSEWEAIIVDDGSTDNSTEVIETLKKKDGRFRLIHRNREPKGAQTCRNIGIAESRGDYIIFLDSDDLLDKDCLQNRLRIMVENPELDFAVFPIQRFHQDPGDKKGIWLYHSFLDYVTGFLYKPQWQTTCPIWKKDAMLTIGGWDESVIRWQDWDFHVRALIAGLKFKVFPERVDAFYRDNYRQKSKSIERIMELEENKVLLFDRIVELLRNHNLLSSINQQLMAANYLQTAGVVNNTGQYNKAIEIWRAALTHGLISNKQFRQGIVYLRLKQNSFFRNKIAGSILRKSFSLLLPRYIICHY